MENNKIEEVEVFKGNELAAHKTCQTLDAIDQILRLELELESNPGSEADK